MGALLFDDAIDQIKRDNGEGWSPIPVLGFRAWNLRPTGLVGVKVRWPKPQMTAECLHHVVGEDLPHSWGKCGPPACGIYATKNLDVLLMEVNRDLEVPAIAVVAMSGKVIEHELGYRAQRCQAVAVAGTIDGNQFATDDPGAITDLFANPVDAVTTWGSTNACGPRTYLTKWKEEHETWIWEKS